MPDALPLITLVAAALTSGLMAGLFCAFSYSVMPGLRRTDDLTFVTAMRQMNMAILNGWFLSCFLGALIFSVAAAVLHLDHGAELAWIVAGAALYAATLLITGVVNVPLNNSLEAVGDEVTASRATAARKAFESSWVRWNLVRSATSTAAFGCLVWALVLHGSHR